MLQDTHTKHIETLLMANDQLLPEVIRLLEEEHTVTLPLRGFSMRPFLEDGRDKRFSNCQKPSAWAMPSLPRLHLSATCYTA